MTTISFSLKEGDAFSVRKAIYRMILTRAKRSLEDPGDLHELELSEYCEGISLFSMPPAQRARVGRALLAGVVVLRADIAAGCTTEEPTRIGIEERLSELVEFMKLHLEAAG